MSENTLDDLFTPVTLFQVFIFKNSQQLPFGYTGVNSTLKSWFILIDTLLFYPERATFCSKRWAVADPFLFVTRYSHCFILWEIASIFPTPREVNKYSQYQSTSNIIKESFSDERFYFIYITGVWLGIFGFLYEVCLCKEYFSLSIVYWIKNICFRERRLYLQNTGV